MSHLKEKNFSNLMRKCEKHWQKLEKAAHVAHNHYSSLDDRIRIVGRHMKLSIEQTGNRGIVLFDWSGVKIEFVVLNSGHVHLDMNGGCSYFNVYIDKQFSHVFHTNHSTASYDILSNTTIDNLALKSSFLVTITNRNEPVLRNCMRKFRPVELYQIRLDVFGAIEKPVHKARRKIEFIGDSDTCAFGVEAKFPSSSFNITQIKGRFENADASFAKLVADNFDADHHIVAHSGKGCSSNAWDPTSCDNTMGELWRRTVCGFEHFEVSVEDEWQPDLVIVALGGNDLEKPVSTMEQFTSAMLELITDIRQRRGISVPILCLSSSKTCMSALDSVSAQVKNSEIIQSYFENVVNELRENENEMNVFYRIVDPKVQFDKKADFGALMHWNAEGHKKFAEQLTEVIQEAIGWERTSCTNNRW